MTDLEYASSRIWRAIARNANRKCREYRRWIVFLASLVIILGLICLLQHSEIKAYQRAVRNMIDQTAALEPVSVDKPVKVCDAGPSEPADSVVTIEPAEPTEPEIQAISLGMFDCYAYYAGHESTGKNPGDPAYGITYSGTVATAGRTVAVDPNVIPLGSLILVDGVPYIAEDTGDQYIQDNAIDIYFDTYEQAAQYGVQQHEVWLVMEVQP